ncbi:MAG TPA: glycosyltransferase family 9 protein [Pirellulales bacterium]|nr:glycosyltransferase family 9 protein [Pirellulales bacterium]
MHPQNVLIVQLSSLADVVHALPAAQAIRAALPGARLGWVVESGPAGIVRRQPWIDETIEWDRHRWGGFRSFTRRLKRTAWDVAIDFQGLFRSGLATRLSGAPRRIGFVPSLEMAHWFYNDCLPLESLNRHAVERNLELATKLGASLPGLPLDRPYLRQSPPASNRQDPRLFPLRPSEDDLAAVAAWGRTRDFQPMRDQLVVLNPYASRPANRWPVNHFIQLAGRLLRRPDVRVALSGGVSARETCDRIAAPFGDALWRADGRFSPMSMAGLFSQASVVVAGDSGPMHLAAAVGAPLVALFGATSALRTGPYASDAIVLDRELACSPCLAKRCPLKYDPPLCMEQISVDRVLAAVVSRLAQPRQIGPVRKSA